jgi:biopolymer transport protein ExbB/TolQ
MEYVSNLMFWISNGLLVPVVVGLLFFFFRAIFMLGGLFNQYMSCSKQEKALKKSLDELDKQNMSTFKSMLEKTPSTKFTIAALQLYKEQNSVIHRNRQISEFEINADKELGKSKVLIKFGPILGLMGTLIPMGPALVGLSTGDIGSMAYNMQVAFATTVLGLCIGAAGFILVQIKQRWIVSDLTNLDFISDLMTQYKNETPCNEED